MHHIVMPLLKHVCHRITEIEGDFIIILYFISLIFLSISMVIAYIRRNTYLSSGQDIAYLRTFQRLGARFFLLLLGRAGARASFGNKTLTCFMHAPTNSSIVTLPSLSSSISLNAVSARKSLKKSRERDVKSERRRDERISRNDAAVAMWNN